MPKANEELWCSLPTHATLGVYVTTKGYTGQTPRILRSREQTTFFVGRAASLCDIVFPQAFISKVHGKIEYDQGLWSYTNLGENKTYVNKSGAKIRPLETGVTVGIKTGDSIQLLFKEPLYCMEFVVDLEKDEDLVDREPTKPGGQSDLSYIDTRIEFFVYCVSIIDKAIRELPLARLLVFAIVVIVLGGWIAWLIF